MLVCARLLFATSLPVLPACYTYTPATLETVPTGAHVRALITPEAERQLLATFGVEQGTVLSGEWQARDRDRVALLVPSVPIGSGPGTRPLYQEVTVPAADVLRVDVRKVDGFRTGVLVAGAAAAVGAILWESLGPGFFSGTPSGNVPPESVRGWVFRIPVSRP